MTTKPFRVDVTIPRQGGERAYAVGVMASTPRQALERAIGAFRLAYGWYTRDRPMQVREMSPYEWEHFHAEAPHAD